MDAIPGWLRNSSHIIKSNTLPITSNEGEKTKSLEAVWRHQVITPAIHFHSSSSCLANHVTCAGILSGTRQIRQKWCEPGFYYTAPKNQHSTWKTVIGSFRLGRHLFRCELLVSGSVYVHQLQPGRIGNSNGHSGEVNSCEYLAYRFFLN